MKASKLLYCLIEGNEFYNLWKRNCTLQDLFGPCTVIGGNDIIHPTNNYIAIYSDVYGDALLENFPPDVVVQLDDFSGKCVFLYEIED